MAGQMTTKQKGKLRRRPTRSLPVTLAAKDGQLPGPGVSVKVVGQDGVMSDVPAADEN